MTATTEYLFEPFLTRFYLLEAICGDFMSKDAVEGMFAELAHIFCISDREALEKCYEASNLAHFRSICDYAAYERFCRTVEFAEISGQEVAMTECDRMILAQKREAMTVKADLLRQGKNITRETVSTTLLDMAMNGSIDAMTTLAYMEYHGICLCKDRASALRRIRLCADWNDLFGNLMGIAYDPQNKSQYYDNLNTVLRGAGQQLVFGQICESGDYRTPCKKNPVAKLIERAFGLNIVSRKQYDQTFAKVAFSELLSIEDKKKLLLNKQKDAIASLSDIPFGIKRDGEIRFDETCADTLPLKRGEEIRKIMQNIAVALRCPSSVYTPLLIVASDEYVTDMYCEMLKKGFGDTPLVELDAATLSEQDFFAAKENVFLRGLSDTKSARTVFVLKNCEQLDDGQLDELMKVLDYEYRKRFKLFQPAVSLDLSGLLFVLLASGHNMRVRMLAECCDTVQAQKIRPDEKGVVIDSIFTSRASSFGCEGMTMEEGCRAFLSTYGTRQAQQIVDGALRNAIYEHSECLTLASMKTLCREQHISADSHGFGYTGGN